MTREHDNLMLVALLTRLVERHPNLRFSQILQNFGYTKVVEVTEAKANGRDTVSSFWEDEFYLESKKLLKRVEEAISESVNGGS